MLTVRNHNWEKIESDNESVQHISEDIYQARRDVIDILHRLR